MNAEADLFAACREWRRLAEAEGEAIRTRNWGLCSACQKALQQLRDRMTPLMTTARDEWSQSGPARAGRQQQLDETLHQLITLERCNQTLLSAIRQAAQAKLEQLHLTRIKLKQLRRSYGSTGKPA